MSKKVTKPAQASTPRKSTGAARPRKAAAKVKTAADSPGDWRSEMLEEIRGIILAADPQIVEERKWRKPSNPKGVPVWSHGGILCTGEMYKGVVKLTFMRGASLADPKKLFNASLEGNARRAIDLREGEKVDAKALNELILAAVAENLGSGAAKRKSTVKAKVTTKTAAKAGAKTMPAAKSAKPKMGGKPKKLQKNENGVVLLSGGNPQIAKADGDAPVQAYIAAMPGWKSGLGRQLDELIVRTVPNVRKAVKWNSPFYGAPGQGWFLSFHVLTRYVKVTFFKGMLLKPIPPGGTEKSGEGRWIDIYEDDELDEPQMAKWIKQAAAIPGWMA